MAKSKEYRKARPEYVLWQGAKHRALRKGIEFNLSINDIIIPELCPVFGITMVQPSVDRVDNTKGYIKGNIRVISNRANRMKGDGTIEDFEQIIKYMQMNS